MHSGRAILIVLFRVCSLRAAGPWLSGNVVFGYFLVFSGGTFYILTNVVHTFSEEALPSSVRLYCHPHQLSDSATAPGHYPWLTRPFIGSVFNPKWRESLSLFFSSFLWPYFVTEDTISSWVHVSHSPFWKLMCHHFSRKGDSCFLQAPSLPCPVYFRADNRWGWDTNTTFQTMKSQVQGELDSSSIGRLQNYKLVQK